MSLDPLIPLTFETSKFLSSTDSGILTFIEPKAGEQLSLSRI
jgi:hypothetical protein